MSAVHLDTHVVLWLHEPLMLKLKPALPHLEGQQVVISPMVLLELQYLQEIGRTAVPAGVILASLAQTVGLRVASSPWEDVVRTSLALDWTRDPFDRLIAAHALTDGAPLVTADERIRTHCPHAVWG